MSDFQYRQDQEIGRSKYYVNSLGVIMAFMTYADALSIVVELASCPIKIPGEHFQNLILTPQLFRQQNALSTVTNILARLEALNLSQRTVYGFWTSDEIADDFAYNPLLPVNALKIVISMAQDNAIEPNRSFGYDVIAEADLQRQAMDVILDLIGDHAEVISRIGNISRPRP